MQHRNCRRPRSAFSKLDSAPPGTMDAETSVAAKAFYVDFSSLRRASYRHFVVLYRDNRRSVTQPWPQGTQKHGPQLNRLRNTMTCDGVDAADHCWVFACAQLPTSRRQLVHLETTFRDQRQHARAVSKSLGTHSAK